MKKTIAALCAVTMLAGCATAPKDIAAARVSTTGYENMSCDQLRTEARSVSERAVVATGVQKEKASGDAAKMTVGLVLFWPALLFMEGDKASAADVARLKGEMQAIESVNARKNCGIQFMPAA